jgi:thiamine-monophosphate kinase
MTDPARRRAAGAPARGTGAERAVAGARPRSRAPRRTDEFGLIGWIRTQVPPDPAVPVGIGDDAAALRLPAGRQLLVTTDMVIDGRHFLSATATPYRIGHKAVARAVSDIAAMAGDGLAVVIAMAAPRGMTPRYFRRLFRGMKAAADALEVRIIGGDISSGDLPLMLTVTVIGAARPGAAVLRSGARPGDAALVTGELGGSLLGRHLDFLPRLREARWLRECAALHAMIDISDGLAADAAHVARESGVGLLLDADAIPVSPAARKAARRSGKTPLEHALHDGEDYELFFTLAARDAARLLIRTDSPVKITRIGEVIATPGLWLREASGKRRPMAPKGWRHEF